MSFQRSYIYEGNNYYSVLAIRNGILFIPQIRPGNDISISKCSLDSC